MRLTHALKCWPEYYQAVVSNAKPFEIRIGDRPYAVGDLFVAQEWCRFTKLYTGRQCVRQITYVGRQLPGLEAGHVALGLRMIR
jgi:hypothetical protein